MKVQNVRTGQLPFGQCTIPRVRKKSPLEGHVKIAVFWIAAAGSTLRGGVVEQDGGCAHHDYDVSHFAPASTDHTIKKWMTSVCSPARGHS